MRPPKDLDLPRGWIRREHYLGTRTDTWRIYVYQTHARGETRLCGELYRMDKDPHVAHRGSIEACIEFAQHQNLRGPVFPGRKAGAF